MKLIKSSIFKRCCILLLLLISFVLISAFSYVNAVSSGIAGSVFRLHVIANSNSDADQALKYKVRDNIIQYINSLSLNLNSKDEVVKAANAHLDDIKQIALDTIHQNGCTYDVNVEIGNFEFPTKQYGDISLPAGFYDALKVEIGAAKRSELVVCYVSSSMFC